MSASVRKDRILGVGIHKAPPNVSATEFKNRWDALLGDILAFPAVKDSNVLRCDMMSSNNVLEANVLSASMSDAQPTVIITGEWETADDTAAFLKDPETYKLALNAEEFKPERGACLFLADTVTRIDRPSSGNRICVVGIFKVPQNVSTAQYERKFDDIVDRFVALPASQKCILKHTVWRQDRSMDTHIKALGIPAPEPTIVALLESESWDLLNELANDVEAQKLAAEINQELGFHEGSHYFSADIVTKLHRH